MHMWSQVYNPLGNAILSTIAAAIPVVTLLVLIASGKVRAHIAAIIALLAAIVVAVFVFSMPPGLAIRAAILGIATGFFPIGWIVLNVIFLYRLTVEKGVFETLQQTIGGVTGDRRLQLLLIAFAFGAFFEGASGFGTPVAVTGAILIGLGFSPLAASGLSLIANTAPVAYGALGTPIAGLASVTGIDPYLLGAMVGRQLPFFMPTKAMSTEKPTSREMWIGLMPWIIVCALLLVWGTGWFKSLVNPIFTWNYAVEGLHNMISKVPPVVAKPTREGAVFAFTYLSFTGSGMLIAAIISGFLMGFSPVRLLRAY